MVNTLTTFTNLIQSPPRALASGAVLFGIVWGFFRGVESVLNENTKLEIAVWLLGVKVGQKLEPWPDTFTKMFDRIFGTKHLSWKCFWRSTAASLMVSIVVFLLTAFSTPLPILETPVTWSTVRMHPSVSLVVTMFWFIIKINVLPDYVSLLKTRWVLSLMQRRLSETWWVLLIIADCVFTLYLTVCAIDIWLMSDPLFVRTIIGFSVFKIFRLWRLMSAAGEWVFFYPAFFTSIWLWLYAGSGFLLKAARRFDIGFDWFNRKFDIEKKPLQSIGLVAGALVAVVYWAAVIVSRSW